MGSELGLSSEQLHAVSNTADPLVHSDRSTLFDDKTLVALAYVDAMTTGDVSDDLFAQIKEHFSTPEIVELTAAIAWENASARFNRALRVESQNLWSQGL